jgi:carboxypeptidase Taq
MKFLDFTKLIPAIFRQKKLPARHVKNINFNTVPAAAPPSILIRQDERHPSEAYTDLKLRFRDIGRLAAVAETMGRDFLTAMPEGAWKSRLSQIIYLHRLMHDYLTDAEVVRQIERAQSHLSNHPGDWDEWDRVNLQEMQRIVLRARHVDVNLTEQETRIAYEGRRHHRHILATGDWAQGREFLGNTIDTKRRIAEAICRGSNQNDPYQVLLDEFMPGLRLGDVEKWFETLRQELSALLPRVMQKQGAETAPHDIVDFYPAKAQMWLNRALLESIGFDFTRGGLYETGHNPVEGGTPDDTRLVIRAADTTNFLDSLKSTLHEGGHGIYIQGLPRQTWRYQPVAQDMGAAMHESQALLVEMVIGRTREFFDFLSPRVEGLFHGLKNPALSADNLYRLKTRVKPTLNRKQADEVTYFFHILQRFRLERDLIGGRLKLADLPEAWNAEMDQLLGLKPENHANGCLQDVHWFVGKFGYFPAYAVGHMMAAQQFHAIKKDIPEAHDMIRQGHFAPMVRWLGQKIHGKGRLQDMDGLMKAATGKPVTPDFLIKHLETRYLKAA